LKNRRIDIYNLDVIIPSVIFGLQYFNWIVNYKITQGLLLYEKITDIKTNFIYITLFVAFQIGIILPTLFADLIEGNKSFPTDMSGLVRELKRIDRF